MPSLISMNQLNVTALSPAAELLPPDWDSPLARRFLLAWAWQETQLKTLRQYGNGPAASYFQFEEPTIRLLLHNPSAAVSQMAQDACRAFDVAPDSHAVWLVFQTDAGQSLAAAFARIDLHCDPHALPTFCGTETTDCAGKVIRTGAWKTYASDVVRPGKPHFAMWRDESWPKACEVIPC